MEYRGYWISKRARGYVSPITGETYSYHVKVNGKAWPFGNYRTLIGAMRDIDLHKGNTVG